jgi:hypothetical protein
VKSSVLNEGSRNEDNDEDQQSIISHRTTSHKDITEDFSEIRQIPAEKRNRSRLLSAPCLALGILLLPLLTAAAIATPLVYSIVGNTETSCRSCIAHRPVSHSLVLAASTSASTMNSNTTSTTGQFSSMLFRIIGRCDFLFSDNPNEHNSDDINVRTHEPVGTLFELMSSI